MHATRIIGPLISRRHGHHLRGAQHLAEALVLKEIESALAAVIDSRNKNRATAGEAELVAAEGRNAAGIDRGGMVEVVARVKGGVAHKLEEGTVKATGARTGANVGEARGAAPDLGRHPTGVGINALDRIHVEVGEGGPAHFRVAGVGAIHGEGRLNAALAVDGELRGEVGCAVDVGHGSGGQQQQGAEVAFVKGQLTHRLARQLLTAGGGLVLEQSDGEFAAAGESQHNRVRGRRQIDGQGVVEGAAIRLHGEPVLALRQSRQAEAAIGARNGLGLRAVAGQPDLGGGDGRAACVAQHSLPNRLRGLLWPRFCRQKKWCRKRQN